MIDALNFSTEICAFRERIEKLSATLAPLESLLSAQSIAIANNVVKRKTTTKGDLMLAMSVSIGQLSSGMDALKGLSGKLLNEVTNIVAEAGSVNEKPVNVAVTSLSNEDISRYSRQLILPDFGVAGQLKLKQSSFLVVGVGGLGCPAAQYLVAAGCGRIGLVDYDLVERSNIHRQTLHSEQSIDLSKVISAKVSLQRINPTCQIDVYQLLLDSFNALELLDQYDIVLDCTDNVATRYLLNDACVLLNKPLVSGSALQLDGQLTVYHYENGPCYRCLFPVPPPAETVTNCGDGGVLGAVTGLIGSLQALEAIKVAIDLGEVLSGRLLIFDGNKCIFRNIKLRPKRSECDICSDTPQITRLINYEQFCGMHPSDKDQTMALLRPNQRISALEYKEKLCKRPHVLVDVRTAAEFEICQLSNAVNVPLKQVLNDSFGDHLREQLKQKQLPCLVYCRRGNDSQVAVQHMRMKFPDHEYIKDIEGGLHAWHHKVDKEFPIY